MGRNAATHADLVTAIRKLIEGDGGFLVKYPGGLLGPRGVADFLGVHRGRPVAVEVKAGKNKLTADQEIFLRCWRSCGGIGLEPRNVTEAARELVIPLLL